MSHAVSFSSLPEARKQWGFKNIRHLVNKAHNIAKQFRQKETELVEILQQLDSTKAYRATGYNSLYQFCVESLQLTEHQAYNYITVAKKCREIPELMVALEDRRLTVSKVRKMSSVITTENKKAWMIFAEKHSQKDLETAVRSRNPLPPVRDHLQTLSKTQAKLQATLEADVQNKLLRVIELLSEKSHKKTSINQALDALCEEFLKKHDPLQRAKRQVSKYNKVNMQNQRQNGGCIKAPTLSSEDELGKKERAPLAPRRRFIPAAIRHQVWFRDQGQCRFHRNGQRCGARKYLELHHKLPVSQGGDHSPQNLVLLCSEHHKGIHQRF